MFVPERIPLTMNRWLGYSQANRFGNASQVGNLRYSRLAVCATLVWARWFKVAMCIPFGCRNSHDLKFLNSGQCREKAWEINGLTLTLTPALSPGEREKLLPLLGTWQAHGLPWFRGSMREFFTGNLSPWRGLAWWHTLEH